MGSIDLTSNAHPLDPETHRSQWVRAIGQAFFPFMISRLLSANLSQHPNNTAIIIIIYHHSSTYSNTIFPPPWFGDCRLVKINICLYFALYVIYVRWPVCDDGDVYKIDRMCKPVNEVIYNSTSPISMYNNV